VIITLGAMRDCFEGAIPAVIATCAPDGTPNVTPLSQVHYMDESHVALSFQFFSKTRENILANPYAMVQVIDPGTGTQYHLSLQYLRTETEGPLFEYMKAKLAGVASHTGMSKVFRLRGSDVYRVLDIQCASNTTQTQRPPQRNRLLALRACSQNLAGHNDLAALFDALLAALHGHFAIPHAMVLIYDDREKRLYTVASRGYAESGIGSEVPLGAGIIGVAAQERTPIRIGYMTSDYAYSRAVRDNLATLTADGLETEIPFPGLAEPHSQMAIPIVLDERLLGVVYVESMEELSFTHEDEDALMCLAMQLAMAIHLQTQHAGETVEERQAPRQPINPLSGASVTIRRYPDNDCIFIGDDYLIKGVAGAIFWKLVSDYTRQQRTDFTNRELRLNPALRLPDITDNLEARLILLQKRLAERCSFLRIEKIGRGRFRLQVDRPFQLSEVAPGAMG
jgi:adenylate cyclase